MGLCGKRRKHLLRNSPGSRERIRDLWLFWKAPNRKNWFKRGWEGLAPRDRLFMKLHIDQGLPVEEVAEALQISVPNAYVVKHRAVERLRTYLVSRGK